MASSPTAPDSTKTGGSAEPSGDSSNERFDIASAERFAESLVPEWEATLHSVEIPLPPESTGTGERPDNDGLDEEPTVADPQPRPQPPSPAPSPPPPTVAAKQVPGPVSSGVAPQASAAMEAIGTSSAPEVGDDDAIDLPGMSASPRSRKGLYAGLGAAVLLVVVGVATTMGSSEEGQAGSASDTTTAAESRAGEEGTGDERAAGAKEPAAAAAEQGETGAASASSDDREAEPAAPRKVVIQVTTTPTDAELYLDGERVDNPLRLEASVDDARHRLEARAEGYRTASKAVRFDRDRRVVLKLKRVRPVRRATSRRVQPRRTTTRSRPSGRSRRRVRKIVTDNPY